MYGSIEKTLYRCLYTEPTEILLNKNTFTKDEKEFTEKHQRCNSIVARIHGLKSLL